MKTWIIGQTPPEDVQRYLLERASQVDGLIVCFDYFDTLVVRDVEPEFTKQLACRLLGTVIPNGVSAEELYEIRRELEKELCEERRAEGGELEFYLPSFAPRFLETLRQQRPGILSRFSAEDFTNLLLDLELAVETRVQHPCQPVVDLLRGMKDAGVPTILVSDFYLPASCFTPMLEQQGLDGLLDHLFVSADYGLAKGSGRLYRKVCQELSCTPDQLLLIGDNPHSDIRMAGQQGIATIHLQNPEQQKYYQQWQPVAGEDHGRIEQRFERAMAPGRQHFPEMARSLWYFMYLLFQALVKQGAENVFFFSKEGEYLKRCFDCFQQEIYGTRLIASHYLLVSRKATYLASLRPLEEEAFTGIFTHYRDISLRDFLLSLNFEESLARHICLALQLDYTVRHADLCNRPEFSRLKESDVFQSVYEERRRQQRDNLISYLDSFGIDYHRHGMTIVDVGWKGSIQDNLYHLLDKAVRFQGYYIGSLIAPNKSENNRKQGLLFDDSPEQTPYFHVYNNNRSLYEMMLGATHGSADGYFLRTEYDKLPDDHDKVVRESIPREQGELCVTTLDLPEERELYERTIKPLQDAMAKSFSRQNRVYIETGCFLPNREWFARQHARMVFRPSQAEVEFFERLYHLENFGVFEYTDFLAEDSFTIRQRLRNLKNVIRDGAILESGTWPPVILRRLGIGLYRYVDGYRRYVRAFKTR